MTDEGFRALASAGCGFKLTALTLSCECCVFSCLSCRRACVLSHHFARFLIFTRAALREGVTDEGLRALAGSGCGENLTSLRLDCMCVFFFPACGGGFHCARVCISLRELAVLREGVTDEGLRALASAGCGRKLATLALSCERLCVFLQRMGKVLMEASVSFLTNTHSNVCGGDGRRYSCTGKIWLRPTPDIARSSW